jgi:uncharacterized protein
MMPEFTSYPAGVPSWVDLQSPDVPVTIGFYGELFGWATEDLGPEAGGYTPFTRRGKWVAGVGPQMMPGTPVAWMTYVGVDDIVASVDVVRDAGGTVLAGPMEVLEAGQLAVVADPVGGVFSLWQPGSHFGAQIANEPAAFVWSELHTRDPDASVAFYTAAFGWGPTTGDFGGVPYTQWMVGERSVGGMMPMPEAMPEEVRAYWLTYFGVESVDAAIALATAKGGSLLQPAIDSPAGRLAVLSDPVGATFAIIELPAES